jgi:Matrixin/Carboxypeptidase regulatory-like domain
MSGRRVIATALCVAIVGAQAQPALAYLEFGVRVGGRSVTLKWAQTPVRYFVSDRAVAGVTPQDFQTAVARAFATWEAVPSSTITYQFGGFTSALPQDEDGQSTLGFLEKPELERVLATTNFFVDNATGALIESDIFFNASFPWSTAAGGQTGRYDVESIALHEIGHFSGLGHSALGETTLLPEGGRRVLGAEAVMFPIAFAIGSTAGRTLRADDIAGISDLYPETTFTSETGTVSGRVTKDGQPVFGAHIVAFNPADGRMVANFALTSQGEFVIAGLSPGPYVIRVEPVDDADLDSFFDPSRNVDVDFKVTYAEKLAIVPRGADSGTITIAVTRK